MDEGKSLSEAVAVLKAMGHVQEKRMDANERSIRDLSSDLEKKHQENRASIHAMRGSQQVTVDSIHRIDVKLARASGYAVGAGTAVGVLVSLLGELIHHIWK